MHDDRNRETFHAYVSGLETSRIEALSDGVFAISMTLLVLNIRIPESAGGNFLSAVVNLWPQVGAYIVSFMVLAVYWIGHHNQFFWIKYANRTLLWINIFFLMSMAFLPFSTSLVAAYPGQIIAIFIYGLNVMTSGVVLDLHWRYATRRGRLTDGSVEPRVSKNMELRILFGIAFYAMSILFSFISTKISLFLFALLPFFYMGRAEVDKYFEQKNPHHNR